MANSISDITVNISIEDVINSAEFGIPLLLSIQGEDDSETLEYTECYSLEEVETAIKDLTTSKTAFEAAATLMFKAENKPEKIAVLKCGIDDLTKHENYGFFHTVLLNTDATTIIDVSNAIETMENPKILFALKVLDTLASSADTAFKTIEENEKTVIIQAVANTVSGETVNNYVTAALVAETSSKPVGSFTYKNIKVKGCRPYENIKKSQLDIIHSTNYNALVEKAGYKVMSEGKTISGQYIDIVESKYWLIMQIEYQLQQALIINDKIPYTNTGINYLESIVVNVLNDAYNNGMINTTDDGLPDYTVKFAQRSETKASDREQRKYIEGKFSFGLAGAIHEVKINGTILI